jgi:hypothetical protein
VSLLDDVRSHLIAQGVVSTGTTSGSAWVCLIGGHSDAIDAPQVALVQRAGLPPLDTHAGPAHARAGVQVLVRGNPRAYAITAAKVDEVYAALQHARFTGVQTIEARSSAAWLGYEPQSDRPLWSLNLIAITE